MPPASQPAAPRRPPAARAHVPAPAAGNGGDVPCARCGRRVPGIHINADGACSACAREMFSRRIKRALRDLDDIDEIARGVRLDWTLYTREETSGMLESTRKIRDHLGRLDRMGGNGGSGARRPAG